MLSATLSLSVTRYGRSKMAQNREPEWKEPRNVCLHVSKHFEVNGLSLVLTLYLPADIFLWGQDLHPAVGRILSLRFEYTSVLS